MISKSSGQFRQNYETKKYSRPNPVPKKVEKKPDPSAEFRILSHSDLDELIIAAEYKIVTQKKKKFLWSVEEKVTIDNYKNFLNSKTKLIDSLNERAFLTFSELINFLKSKNITIVNDLPENAKQKFATRDEYPILLDFQSATKLQDKLRVLEITDEDLKKSDIDNLHKLRDNLFDKQRLEIETLTQVLNKVKSDTILLIRIKD